MGKYDSFLDSPAPSPAGKYDSFLDDGLATSDAGGGFMPAAKQAIGAGIKGLGQAATDFIPGVEKDNALSSYGQSVIDANPTAIRSLGDIADKPLKAITEATGNAGGSMASMLGALGVGKAMTAAAPFTGPFAPAVAGAGQLVANVGPFVAAALPSYGGIRGEQIAADPLNEQDGRSKAIALLGAGTVGAIEGSFGPQAWASAAMEKGGFEAVAKNFAAAKSLPGFIGKGALKGAAVEGAEELVQNPVEQIASYQDPTTGESISDTALSGAMGAIGGGVLGGSLAGVSYGSREQQPTTQQQPAPQPVAPPSGPMGKAAVTAQQSGAVDAAEAQRVMQEQILRDEQQAKQAKQKGATNEQKAAQGPIAEAGQSISGAPAGLAGQGSEIGASANVGAGQRGRSADSDEVLADVAPSQTIAQPPIVQPQADTQAVAPIQQGEITPDGTQAQEAEQATQGRPAQPATAANAAGLAFTTPEQPTTNAGPLPQQSVAMPVPAAPIPTNKQSLSVAPTTSEGSRQTAVENPQFREAPNTAPAIAEPAIDVSTRTNQQVVADEFEAIARAASILPSDLWGVIVDRSVHAENMDFMSLVEADAQAAALGDRARQLADAWLDRDQKRRKSAELAIPFVKDSGIRVGDVVEYEAQHVGIPKSTGTVLETNPDGSVTVSTKDGRKMLRSDVRVKFTAVQPSQDNKTGQTPATAGDSVLLPSGQGKETGGSLPKPTLAERKAAALERRKAKEAATKAAEARTIAARAPEVASLADRLKAAAATAVGSRKAALEERLVRLEAAKAKESAEEPKAPKDQDSFVGDQLSRFEAGNFSVPRASANLAGGKSAKDTTEEMNRRYWEAYNEAAKQFLEGDLTAKVPGARAEPLRNHELRNVKPKPITKNVGVAKTLDAKLKALAPVAGDKTEVRTYLQGVHVESSGRLVATNGNQMAVVDGVSLDGLPAKPEDDKQFHYTVLGNDGKWIDGKFPDYERVMPTKHATNPETVSVTDLGNYARGVRKAAGYSHSKFVALPLHVGNNKGFFEARLIEAMANAFRSFGHGEALVSMAQFPGSQAPMLYAVSKDGTMRQVVMGMNGDVDADQTFAPFVVGAKSDEASKPTAEGGKQNGEGGKSAVEGGKLAGVYGYSSQPDSFQWAAKEVGGAVVYSRGDIALVEGFSPFGNAVYAGVKGDSRTRADISAYTGKMFSETEKAELEKAKADHVKEQGRLHEKAPDGPFSNGARFAKADGVSDELAGVAQKWLSMLGIKSRVFLATKADVSSVAAIDKYNLRGPFSAIRSAGTKNEADGGKRTLPNGDHYIILPKSARKSHALEALAHEIGHILESDEWKGADRATKDAVMADYQMWLDTAGNTKAADWVKQLRAHTSGKLTRVATSETADRLPPYWRSFGEYFADQVSRWATTSDKPLTAVDTFFKRIALAMRRLYAMAAGKPYLPGPAMKAYLDARGESSPLPISGKPSAEAAPAEAKAPEAKVGEADTATMPAQKGVGNQSAQATITPSDSAIYDMAREGKSAQEILAFIRASARRRFDRHLANALMNLGVKSTIKLDMFSGWKISQALPGKRYAAAYSPKTDTVAIFTPRGATQSILHELVHAATLKALANPRSRAAIEMRRLFKHVQDSGLAEGMYGTRNLEEFVAEAFSNPKFQQALMSIPAPSGSSLKSAWEWFVGVVARMLGMRRPAQATALDRAMVLGAAVMNENAAIAGNATGGNRYAIAHHGTPHVLAPEPGFPHGRFRLDKIGTGEGAQVYGWGVYFAENKGVAGAYQKQNTFRAFDLSAESAKLGFALNAAARGEVVRQASTDKPSDLAAVAVQRANIAARDVDSAKLANLIAGYRAAKEGSIYRLDIPDDVMPKLMDWDKPLSEQPEAVRKALAGKSIKNRSGQDLLAMNPTGNEIVAALGKEEGASEYLASIGIPGLRYLDGDSRNRPLKEIKREFLNELPEDAEFSEVEDLIGTGKFSPKNDALLKALKADDWLGFDYPAQAVSAALGSHLGNFDASKELLQAVEAAKEGGTHNYVIWDQKTLDRIALLERNGQALDDIRFREADDENVSGNAIDEQSDTYAAAVAAGNKRAALRILHSAAGISDNDASIDRGANIHAPAGTDNGSPLYDVSKNGTYPEDVYSYNGRKYYSTGEDRLDAEAYRLIKIADGRPNMPIRIYRAVEKSSSAKIAAGDWVTPVRQYAKDHAEGNISGETKILSKLVHARDIFTSGDSWLEWGYHPQAFKPEFPKTDAAKEKSLANRIDDIRFREADDENVSGNVGGDISDTITIDGVERPRMNSNGKPIAQTDEALRKFYAWFKNSRVVDEQGRPLVVYHGSKENFSVFDSSFSDPTMRGIGFHVTSEKRRAAAFSGGAEPMALYVSMSSPLQAGRGFNGRLEQEHGKYESAKAVSAMKAKGYDGLEFSTPEGKHFAPFDAVQLKSATGENNEFSPDNPDIRFREADDENVSGNVSGDISDTITIDGVERPRMNSNGKPIAQTDEALRKFWRWFAGSKVVDSNERPRVVFHGSKTKNDAIEAFELQKAGTNTDSGWLGKGFYFGDERAAEVYAGHYEFDPGHFPQGGVVYPVYLALKNPMMLIDSDRNDGPRTMVREALDMADNATAEEVGEALIAAGHDGVIYQRTVSGRSYREYVVFRPEQIKSATGNAGEFSPDNPDIRFREQDSPGQWQSTEPGLLDDVIYKLQHKQIDTRRTVQAITKAIGDIADQYNPELKESLYHGRAANETRKFLDFELRPLTRRMIALGVDTPTLETFLWARHAEERNAHIAKINPRMPDGGSGLTNAQAKQLLAGNDVTINGKTIAGVPQNKLDELGELSAMADAMLDKSRELLVENGLETRATIDVWKSDYPHYVPLHREEFEDDRMTGRGLGMSVKGPSGKRAIGSDKPVGNILAAIVSQRELYITRAEENRVGNALYGLATTAPNEEFWKAVDPAANANRDAEALWAQIKQRMTKLASMPNGDPDLEAIIDGMKAQHKAMMKKAIPGMKKVVDSLVSLGLPAEMADRVLAEPKELAINPRTGMVVERVNPLLRHLDNVVATRINGRDVFVVFDARDKRASRMAIAMKNLDADQLGFLLGNMAKATRYFAAINTQFNPIFGVTNFVRDIQTAMLNLSSTPLADHKKEVATRSLSAMRGIYSDLRAHRAGDLPSSKWAAMFERFKQAGGATGYRDMFETLSDRSKDLQDELKKMSMSKGRRLFTLGQSNPVFAWLSDYNEMMENSVRVAAFSVGIEQGLSDDKAASLAKELTVNFNKKGQVAAQAGAMYAFFNAAVQGSARIAQTLFVKNRDNKVRLSPVGSKIVSGGIMLGVVQAFLGALAGWDDEEPPQFVRERSLIIPLGDHYFSVPMPLGFNVLPNIGRITAEFALSGFKDPAKRIGSLLNVLADTLIPIGNAGVSLQTIAPTVIDPLAALAENKDWTGKPIKRMSFNEEAAGYKNAKDTATVWSKWIAEGLNYLSGGTEHKAGLSSPTPDQIDYLIGQVTGGVGREISKAVQSSTSVFSGEDLPLYKVPLVGKFVGDTKGNAADASRFYANVRDLKAHKAELDGRRKAGQDVAEYLRDNPDARLVVLASRIERRVQELRRAKRELIDQGAPKDRVKQAEDQIAALMKALNNRVQANQRAA